MYKITIEKIDTVEYDTTERRDRLRPATEADFTALGDAMYTSVVNRRSDMIAPLVEGKFPTVAETYYEQVTKSREERVEVLRQTVEELDLPAVIRAINNLQ